MKKFNIGILGATGAVGQEMRKVLYEYQIPVGELRLLASARSAGENVAFGDREIVIQETTENSFDGLDFVLGAVEGPMSQKFAPAIKKSGAIYIDNSSAFRLDPDVPLVVPEINGEDALQHKGIIANPNCCTIIALMAVAGIAKLSPIQSMIACTYQAVSGAGQAGLAELEEQMAALAKGEKPVVKTFATQIALNVIPFIDAPYGNVVFSFHDYPLDDPPDKVAKSLAAFQLASLKHPCDSARPICSGLGVPWIPYPGSDRPSQTAPTGLFGPGGSMSFLFFIPFGTKSGV